ncbi:YdbC family protein [Mycoplasmopsis gallinarum]|uniref:YdbC family protein n=1 Tax=Mycoplasmopsis gallinarum TaxID=29557 RepID=UPI00048843C7|nr:PC4/YdbC family ssDNA-binding protein [Mycoplasmopsis gallinarum]
MAIRNNAEVRYEIKKHYGTISTNDQASYKKELNLVSWNGGQEKFDIRDWNSDHSRMTKGITLTREEAQELLNLLDAALNDEE